MMRKQFQKVREKAEGYLQRPNRSELPEDLKDTEKRVEKFRKVVERLEKKILPSTGQPKDENSREKRKKKIYEYTFAASMEENIVDLPESSLKTSLTHCLSVQKELAQEKIKNEEDIEDKVWNNLHQLLGKLDSYTKQKSIESKCASDYEQAKSKYENAKNTVNNNSSKTMKSVEASQSKIEQYKEEMEESETRLDKERDIYISYMYDLLAEEETVVRCLLDYVTFQETYYKQAREVLSHAAQEMREIEVNRKVFGTKLHEHLEAIKKPVAFVIELSVAHLLHKGIHEEGLFRVGCSNHKLQRLKSAIDAGQYTEDGFREYNDPHVFAALLKTYLRELPDPLLTYELYTSFIELASVTGDSLKELISHHIQRLPTPNYDNLRYLMCFLYRFSKELSRTRMTTQNIAIVISPNLLWAPEEQSIEAQMSSAAAVNTIVEQLISDYPYFFGAEVELGIADLNGGFDEGSVSGGGSAEPKTAAVKSQMSQSYMSYQKPLRTPAGSDGTSQINLGLPRSGSNNSMSDAGVVSDAHTSPKLPLRKNKKAPVPPIEKQEAQTQTSNAKKSSGGLVRTTSTENITKSDVSVHNQTYGFHTMGRASSQKHRPSPLPRHTIISNEKIYENTMSDTANVVQHREKPAIPERPAILPVRPTSKPILDYSPPISAHQHHEQQQQQQHHHEPLLRQTSISTIEKQQVSIIDLGNGGGHHTKSTSKKPPSGRDNSSERVIDASSVESSGGGNNGHNNHQDPLMQQVPRSPRGNNNNNNNGSIKRPQIPAPPPPSRPKSSGDGDSTNL